MNKHPLPRIYQFIYGLLIISEIKLLLYIINKWKTLTFKKVTPEFLANLINIPNRI